MQSKQWIASLLAGLGVLASAAAVGALLAAQGMPRTGFAVLWCTTVVGYFWIAALVFSRLQVRWKLWLGIHTAIAVAIGLMIVPLNLAGSTTLALVLLTLSVAGRLLVVWRASLAAPQLAWPALCILGGIDVLGLSRQLWAAGHTPQALAVVGMLSITLLFVAGLWLIRAVLAGPRPIFGVARTVIDEAIRMKVALIFIVALVMAVPLLPVLVDGELRLQYQLQVFLSWSMTATALLMGLMTVFLSCATICGEISRHQIYLTATKPVGRGEYLLGKWLGIVLLDLLLLSVLCGGIYTFTRVIQNTVAPRDAQDYVALRWQVLTARQTVRPRIEPSDLLNMQYMGKTLKELQEQNEKQPKADRIDDKGWQSIHQTLMTRWHTISAGNPQTFEFQDLLEIRKQAEAARLRREEAQIARLAGLAASDRDPQRREQLATWSQSLREAVDWHAEAKRLGALIAAGDSQDTARLRREAEKLTRQAGGQTYQTLLAAAPDMADLMNPSPQEVLQLRFKPKTSARPVGEQVLLGLRINGNPYLGDGSRRLHTFARDNFHVVQVPAELIDDNGMVVVQIANHTRAADAADDGSRPPVTVSFTPGEGLEVLYTVGGFEGNLLRSAVIIWICLCFLAMFGLAAGTFLGFPVASMLSLVVFISCSMSGYLDDSLYYYGQFASREAPLLEQIQTIGSRLAANVFSGNISDALKTILALVGKLFVIVTPSFNDYNPIPSLTDGRLVTPGRVGSATLWVGAVSTGTCGVFGWIVFKGRELARVTV